MNVFDLFDVDENGKLSRPEFELFTLISENKETSDEVIISDNVSSDVLRMNKLKTG